MDGWTYVRAYIRNGFSQIIVTTFQMFSDVFGCVSDVFGRFLDVFRMFSILFWMFLDVLGRFFLRFSHDFGCFLVVC